MTKASVAVMPRAEPEVHQPEEQKPHDGPMCKNCHTLTTPLWRRNEQGAVLCNACGLFLKLHGRPRPISLKTDVIKSRNRKSAHSSSNPNSTMLNQSPGDMRKKENKKRKIQDLREISAAETLETILKFENGPRSVNKNQDQLQQHNESTPSNRSTPGVTGMMAPSQNILSASNDRLSPRPPPATSALPSAQNSGSLPHLSILLESMKSAEDRSREQQKHKEVSASSLDPELLRDQARYHQQHNVESPRLTAAVKMPLPLRQQSDSNQRTESNRSLQPVGSNSPPGNESQDHAYTTYMQRSPSSRHFLPGRSLADHGQVPHVHMASINEILGNQRSNIESPSSFVVPMGTHNSGQPPIPQAQSPRLKNVTSTTSTYSTQRLRRNSSEVESESYPRADSQVSDSPPPIDIQTSLPIEPGTESRSAMNHSASTKHHRQKIASLSNGHRQESEKHFYGNGHGGGAQASIRTLTPHDSRHSSGEVIMPASASLMSLLQSQEEVIKLKTRISELELVTDLYKRHIVELDTKCRSLEERLGNRN
ncbi:LADA_0D11936g1_1 [Lachancea dasiensis]|uniref:LADA_0D11936g1_1 n=1 Tax=Lachancea dasiensis TaxID=1072105 RepID=A0A1G4J8B9_9SACH|nr:LADA_0D11936g1_1 [Lachancea dasiensis]